MWKVMLVLFSGSDSLTVVAALNEFERYAERPAFAYWSERIDVFMRSYESALSRRSTPGDYVLSDSGEFYLNRGEIYSLMGNDRLSRVYYDSTRLVCESRRDSNAANWQDYCNLAVAYAGLGKVEEALAACRIASELMPPTVDALDATEVQHAWALVYTRIGNYDSAIDILDSLLQFPSKTQIEGVRRIPWWDPLRDHPRFQALLEKYSER
jgi:tetratricopeptide (TPR) repeat protein